MTSWPLAVSTWDEEEIDAAVNVLRSQNTTMGDHVKTFERQFADYHSMKHGIMVNSGSSANLIAIASLFYKGKHPFKPEDEVIVPAIAWATTYHPLHQYGLTLNIVDVDIQTLNIDIKQIKKAITKRTKAIIGVSILGNPAALHSLQHIAEEHNLYLIEDNCESLDAELHGKKCGTFGLLNTFSFFFSHHISTMEGGMILTNDDELADLCRSLRAHGWDREMPDHGPFEEYKFLYPGYNVRPLEISGAIGIEQLKKLPKFTAQRRANWEYFQKVFSEDKKLKNTFIIQKPVSEGAVSSAFAFTLIPWKMNRAEIFAVLKKAGIGCRMITGGNIRMQPVWQTYSHSIDKTPKADFVHKSGLFVGNHPYDLRSEIDHLAEVLRGVL